MDDPIESPPQRRRLSLLHVFLVIAIAAIVTAFWDARRQTQTLQAQLPALRSAARELIIEDPREYAAVHRHETWWDEMVWDVYLPPGNDYQLCIAEGMIGDDGFIEPADRLPIGAGRPTIEVDIDGTEDARVFTLMVDGQKRWSRHTAVEQVIPNESSGSSGGSEIGDSASQPTDQPLVLFKRRYHRAPRNRSWNSDDPNPGYLLWIETAEGSAILEKSTD